jgi:hypothetical protein
MQRPRPCTALPVTASLPRGCLQSSQHWEWPFPPLGLNYTPILLPLRVSGKEEQVVVYARGGLPVICQRGFYSPYYDLCFVHHRTGGGQG